MEALDKWKIILASGRKDGTSKDKGCKNMARMIRSPRKVARMPVGRVGSRMGHGRPFPI